MHPLAHDLFEMARTGSADALLAHVDAGVPVNLTDGKGNTLLTLAAYHGHQLLVAQLAERGADVDRLNDRGQSPLTGAVHQRRDAVVRTLLGLGADPDHGTPSARATAEAVGRPLAT
ncbi:ankyrin repeat domain-containing protein [Nocardioides sp. URHA0032]|uniref:ankyrin repeat domain-containing protein n=1 Tax=Nocardioides sp. URHA0032 TaxID=1380388 RepID=UPI00048DDA48|nr:ankyrin repeat domain-containing protein [Nocardioides sp. URHA0032]